MKRKTIHALTALIILITAVYASAARVGIYIDDGEGGITGKCRDFGEGATAYDVIKNDGDFVIKDYGWGYAICSVKGNGCPEENCFCDPSGNFWNFLYNRGSWRMSSVGVGDHNIEDREIIGFKWGQWGATPDDIAFEDVCPPVGRGKKIVPKYIGFASIGEPTTDRPVVINVTDNKTDKPVKNALVEFFKGGAGWTGSFLQVKTDKKGIAEAELPEEGEYGIRVTAFKYHHKYDNIEVAETTTTTTTSTSTTTTTTTTASTTTTTTLKHFIEGKEKPTTPKPTTTVKKQPKIMGGAVTRPKPEPEEAGFFSRLLKWLFR